jgi:hypothetical protein
MLQSLVKSRGEEKMEETERERERERETQDQCGDLGIAWLFMRARFVSLEGRIRVRAARQGGNRGWMGRLINLGKNKKTNVLGSTLGSWTRDLYCQHTVTSVSRY